MNERNQAPAPYETEPGVIRVEATGNEAEAAAIQADIERTRARMSDTVEQLGDRLDPDRLKDQLTSNLHDATIGKAEKMARSAADRVDRTRHSIMDNLRDNPIPTAMVGLGLGWLFVNSRRDDDDHARMGGQDRYGMSPIGPYQPLYDDRESFNRARGRYPDSAGRYSERASSSDGIADRASEMGDNLRDRAEEMTSDARERAEGIADRARDRVTDIAYEARDTAEDIADRAQDALESGRMRAQSMANTARRGTHRVEDRFEHVLQDSPLAVGAAAAAIGLAIGLSAPATRRESELMGDTRDRLVDRARERAEEFGDRAQDVASRVADDARETLEEAAEEEGMR